MPTKSLLMALALAGLAGPALAQGSAAKFDGRWSVEVITEKGDCDRAYRYAVAIDKGEVRYAGTENFQVTGKVQPNGAVQGTIGRGGDRVAVKGQLDGANGVGTWSAAGNTQCSGRWNAEKRG
ncbi:hypothetical protein [Salinarimonas soli]|uniref:Large exoprotein involved in heme utilization or adhesion n=1 Tax=Salinarimonas soli TaxID=1638099 RepID=A0A5B2VD04_9HYPH|nr:hypothetical protein [Salinarimonas soli]KAA2237363.1 hypothetical protein F0L46_10210 [Salinarimonas soli]